MYEFINSYSYTVRLRILPLFANLVEIYIFFLSNCNFSVSSSIYAFDVDFTKTSVPYLVRKS